MTWPDSEKEMEEGVDAGKMRSAAAFLIERARQE